MRNITLKNVTNEEVSTLQQSLFDYQDHLSKNLRSAPDLLNAIIYLDIAFRLWFSLRNKFEKQEPKKGYSITLKPSEAAVLLKCCLSITNADAFTLNVMRKFSSILDQQLKSLA